VSAEKPWMDDFERQMADFARLAEIEREGALQLSRRRSDNRSSVVYSLRLGREEVEALEKRAAVRGVKPTALARNLIRIGLIDEPLDLPAIVEAVGRVEDACAELRGLLP
jgi:hypothetical protein